MSQMGTLISLDCLLYQMKAERTVDIFGVTLQLARSCCLMTPTLVGGREKGWWGGWSRVFVLTSLSWVLPAKSSLSRDLFHASSPPRAEGTDFAQARVFHLLSSELRSVKLHVNSE